MRLYFMVVVDLYLLKMSVKKRGKIFVLFIKPVEPYYYFFLSLCEETTQQKNRDYTFFYCLLLDDTLN